MQVKGDMTFIERTFRVTNHPLRRCVISSNM